MNATPHSSGTRIWSRLLIMLGSIGMLLGAVDPMEGSVIILPGSGLVALGTFLAQGERRVMLYRVAVFVLIAIGVGALWGLSRGGGIGGNTGHSMWWGLLILPYVIGWSMGIWGPQSPRWVLILGMGVGAWYLVLMTMIFTNMYGHRGPMWALPGFVIGAVGLLTIAGCISRWRTEQISGVRRGSNL